MNLNCYQSCFLISVGETDLPGFGTAHEDYFIGNAFFIVFF